MKQALCVLLTFHLCTLSHAGCPNWLAAFGRWSGMDAKQATTVAPPSTIAEDAERLLHLRILHGEDRKIAEKQYDDPGPAKPLEAALVIASWSMAAFFAAQIASGMQADPKAILYAVLLAPPALFSADLTSAFVHKFLDSYASESNPVWGTTARAFRHHHEFPEHNGNWDYITSVASASKIAAPILAVAPFANLSPEWGAALWIFTMAGMNSNWFHNKAHQREPGLFWALMQKMKLTIGRRHHLEHHSPPFDTGFGILSGWSNGITAWMDLWNRLDSLYWRSTGRMPNNWIQDPRSIPPQAVQAIEANLASVPPALWEYFDAFPARMPSRVEPIVERSREAWRQRYVSSRKQLFEEAAKSDFERANDAWMEEQSKYPKIFGEPQPLMPCSADTQGP